MVTRLLSSTEGIPSLPRGRRTREGVYLTSAFFFFFFFLRFSEVASSTSLTVGAGLVGCKADERRAVLVSNPQLRNAAEVREATYLNTAEPVAASSYLSSGALGWGGGDVAILRRHVRRHLLSEDLLGLRREVVEAGALAGPE